MSDTKDYETALNNFVGIVARQEQRVIYSEHGLSAQTLQQLKDEYEAAERAILALFEARDKEIAALREQLRWRDISQERPAPSDWVLCRSRDALWETNGASIVSRSGFIWLPLPPIPEVPR